MMSSQSQRPSRHRTGEVMRVSVMEPNSGLCVEVGLLRED